MVAALDADAPSQPFIAQHVSLVDVGLKASVVAQAVSGLTGTVDLGLLPASIGEVNAAHNSLSLSQIFAVEYLGHNGSGEYSHIISVSSLNDLFEQKGEVLSQGLNALIGKMAINASTRTGPQAPQLQLTLVDVVLNVASINGLDQSAVKTLTVDAVDLSRSEDGLSWAVAGTNAAGTTAIHNLLGLHAGDLQDSFETILALVKLTSAMLEYKLPGGNETLPLIGMSLAGQADLISSHEAQVAKLRMDPIEALSQA